MTIDLTQIILALIALLSAVLTGYIIPLLKAKLSVEEGKLTETQANMLKLAADTAVKAAEQYYKSDEGQKKKSYVLDLLSQQGYQVDAATVDAAIESAVNDLKRETQK